MEWLSELVKQITISKTLTFSLFVTSATLLFGHLIFPAQIDLPLGNIKLSAIGCLVFSGMLLFVWLSHSIWELLVNAKSVIAFTWKGRNLSNEETSFIEAVGAKANEPLNLSLSDYAKAGISKLEILHIANGLREKGFVAQNPYDETIVWLTPRGRSKALELLKSKEVRNA